MVKEENETRQLLSKARAAHWTDAQLLFHQQADPEKRQTEDQKRAEDNPTFGGNSLFRQRRIIAPAMRALVAPSNARRAVRLYCLRRGNCIRSYCCGRSVIAHVRSGLRL